MARRRYRSGRRTYKRRDPGLEAAKRQYDTASVFPTAVGEIDKHVKACFFALDQERLLPILDAYERLYGKRAREYAEQTIPAWRSGQVRMSGMVAGRLVALLPTYMPVEEKFALVKSLWEIHGRQSYDMWFVGPDVTPRDLSQRVREHFTKVVVEHAIPDSIKRRFEWLAENDVEMQEQLYNYFLQLDRDIVTEAADRRVPALLAHVRAHKQRHQQITQTITVRDHQLTLVFDQGARGIDQRDAGRRSYGVFMSGDGTGCLLVITALAAAVVLLAAI